MKFGGTSVGDVAAFVRVIRVISTQVPRRPVIVVSAMNGITDALLSAFEIAREGDLSNAFQSVESLLERHLKVSRHFIDNDRPNLFNTELELVRVELSELLVRASRRSLPLAMLKDAKHYT
jgi:aspartokinase